MAFDPKRECGMGKTFRKREAELRESQVGMETWAGDVNMELGVPGGYRMEAQLLNEG